MNVPYPSSGSDQLANSLIVVATVVLVMASLANPSFLMTLVLLIGLAGG